MSSFPLPRRLAPLLVLLLAACNGDKPDDTGAADDTGGTDTGDTGDTGDSADSGIDTAVELPAEPELYARLAEIPGLTVVTTYATDDGATAVELLVEQPVDHDDPDGPTFEQWVTLRHVDFEAPLVLLDTGYTNYYGPVADTITQHLAGNQIAVEKRYFGVSFPEGDVDWTTMEVEQVAADTHHVVELLAPLYAGPWISTGGSLGGVDTLYHRMLYPDDVAGSVVVSVFFAESVGDERSLPFFSEVVDQDCEAGIVAIQAAMLTPRADGGLREDYVANLQAWDTYGQFTYERAGGIDAATDWSMLDFRWNFWQVDGSAESCAALPDPAVDPVGAVEFATAWTYLSGYPTYCDQDVVPTGAWVYQAAHQLGYPAIARDGIEELLDPGMGLYTERFLPEGAEPPAFEGTSAALADWLLHDADRVYLLTGERDPWASLRPDLSGAEGDVVQLVAPDTNHYAFPDTLTAADAAALEAALDRWTGG